MLTAGGGEVLGLCPAGTVKVSVHPAPREGPLPHFIQAFIEHFLMMIHMDVAFLGWLTLVLPGACRCSQ